ncbi:hypothetical protein Droror1_Dr00006034 [Drosera rotundifolia]
MSEGLIRRLHFTLHMVTGHFLDSGCRHAIIHISVCLLLAILKHDQFLLIEFSKAITGGITYGDWGVSDVCEILMWLCGGSFAEHGNETRDLDVVKICLCSCGLDNET